MSLPFLDKAFPDPATAARRTSETVNNILNFNFDDSRIQTAAEIAAEVTPVNYAFVPGPFIDPTRYGFSINASPAANTTALNNAIKVANRIGGWVWMPPGIFAIASTIILLPNVVLWGSGCGDSSTVGSASRATILQPSGSFSGTDVIRADPADFGTDVYCRGVCLSNFMIDMQNATSIANLVGIRLKSVSDNPTFDNLRVWNLGDTHTALRIGVSTNSGALLSDGTIFHNFVCLTAGTDTYTGSLVILEDCNEIAIRDSKILARSNGAPQSTSIGIQIKATAIGCQGVTLDGNSYTGVNAGVETTATGGGVGARWVRVTNGTFETVKFGIFFTGTLALQTQFAWVAANRFISNVAGGANVTLDFAANCTIFMDEFSLTTNVNCTANSSANWIFAQLAGITDSGTNNLKMGRNGNELQVSGIQTSEGSFTLTNTAGISGSPTGTARYTLIGNNVTLYLPGINGAASGTAITFSGIPSVIQPAHAQAVALQLINNSANEIGMMNISALGGGGVCSLSRNSGAFSNTGNQGMGIISVTYNLL